MQLLRAGRLYAFISVSKARLPASLNSLLLHICIVAPSAQSPRTLYRFFGLCQGGLRELPGIGYWLPGARTLDFRATWAPLATLVALAAPPALVSVTQKETGRPAGVDQEVGGGV